ncbi:butyrophilin subfamily 2 member A2 [Fundulus heteroclitus]|uniref:butyrophilin subfamily 2 member A2 n=1 Tax=Fundulus heteroclitus TaxID=8078 RepID=UPI00165CC6D1|nr:butyrophilin subfamily 2 member A2 [Fundulus heteroclitus]
MASDLSSLGAGFKWSQFHICFIWMGLLSDQEVWSVSSPAISLAGLDPSNSGVMLDCSSTGWYPEPGIFWLDGEGSIMSAGPSETTRSPDGLYTVSSRITVEKRHNNNVTCRVQQKDINQTRETHFYVQDGSFVPQPDCSVSVSFAVILGLMVLLGAAAFCWKWRQTKTLMKKLKEKENEENQKLLKVEKQNLAEKMLNLEEELKKRNEDQRSIDQQIEALMKMSEELKEQKKRLTDQRGEAEKMADENDRKLRAVDDEVEKQKENKTEKKAQGYLKLKEIMADSNDRLVETKKSHQQMELMSQKLMSRTSDEVTKLKERKQELEKQVEEIKTQLKEMETQIVVRSFIFIFRMVQMLEQLSLNSMFKEVLFGKVMFGFLLLVNTCKGQSLETNQPQLVTAMVGEDVVLPCHLGVAVNVNELVLEWGRQDLNPRFVYVWFEGSEYTDDQNTAYRGRTSLFTDRLRDGDVSLRLTGVRHSDNARFRCYDPKGMKEYFINLLVGSVSSPAISLAGRDGSISGVMLDCSSAGWFPEPEIFWLDGEGSIISAGAAEKTRSPDGLYTVRSRVTVEKRHNNNITCRVQQKNINQTRETQFYVQDGSFVPQPDCSVSVSFTVILAFMVLLGAAAFCWNWRKTKTFTGLRLY